MKYAFVTVAVAATLWLSACGSGGGLDSAGLGDLEAGIRRGDSCAALFEIRNGMEEGPIRMPANERLRDVGCFSSSSTRTD